MRTHERLSPLPVFKVGEGTYETPRALPTKTKTKRTLDASQRHPRGPAASKTSSQTETQQAT